MAHHNEQQSFIFIHNNTHDGKNEAIIFDDFYQ